MNENIEANLIFWKYQNEYYLSKKQSDDSYFMVYKMPDIDFNESNINVNIDCNKLICIGGIYAFGDGVFQKTRLIEIIQNYKKKESKK